MIKIQRPIEVYESMHITDLEIVEDILLDEWQKVKQVRKYKQLKEVK